MAVTDDFTVIPDESVDKESPLKQSLTRAWTSNQNHNLSLVRSTGAGLCIGAADAITDVANSVITDTAPPPTSGATASALAGHKLVVTSGAAAGTIAEVLSSTATTITVDINLVTAGMLALDTYKVIYGINPTDQAHIHNDIDSPKVSSADLSGPAIVNAFTWIDDGTQVFTQAGSEGLISISSQVPVGTVNAQIHIAGTTDSGGGNRIVNFREPGSAQTFRTMYFFSGFDAARTVCANAIVPVNSSREIEIDYNSTAGANGEVRSYQL